MLMISFRLMFAAHRRNSLFRIQQRPCHGDSACPVDSTPYLQRYLHEKAAKKKACAGWPREGIAKAL
jgi:hypothetical protein